MDIQDTSGGLGPQKYTMKTICLISAIHTLLIIVHEEIKVRIERHPKAPEVGILTAPEAVTRTDSRTSQRHLGTLVNRGRRASHTASLDQLPETSGPMRVLHIVMSVNRTTR